MPINPSDPGQSATLFLEEAAKFLREAQENGDTIQWWQTDTPEPDYERCVRRISLEITQKRPKEF